MRLRPNFTVGTVVFPNLVDDTGVEPVVPGAADLQSAGVTNFPTHPNFIQLITYL